MMSLEDFTALEETAYLLRVPKGVRCSRRGMYPSV